LKGQSIYPAAKANKYLIYKLVSLSENQNKALFFPMYVIKKLFGTTLELFYPIWVRKVI
jgi:hypothetical protein